MESIRVKAQERASIFVNRDEEGVWLNIMHIHGSTHCIVNPQDAQDLLEAIKKCLESGNE